MNATASTPISGKHFTAADFEPVQPLDPQRSCPDCRRHPGVYYLASGAPIECPRYVPSLRDASRQREYADRTGALVATLRARATARGASHTARLLTAIRNGLWALETREPKRLPALYASVANGRVDAVIDALVDYWQTHAAELADNRQAAGGAR